MNLLTNLADPDLIRPWWWALVICLAALVYISVLRIERRVSSVVRIAACSPGDGRLYLSALPRRESWHRVNLERVAPGRRGRGRKLPGIKARDVSALTATRDILEVYVVDSDGTVLSRRLGSDGRSWSRWENLSTSGELGPVVAVAAYSGSPNWRELYAVGANGKVAHRWRQDGHPWHSWHVTKIHGEAQDIALTAAVRDMLECFVIIRGGELWHRWFLDRKWSEWGNLGRPEDRSTIKTVAAISGQEKHQEVFALDTQGDLAHGWHWQGNEWSEWHGFPTPEKITDISAAATSPGRWHVTAIGESGGLWQRAYRAESNWSDWERIR